MPSRLAGFVCVSVVMVTTACYGGMEHTLLEAGTILKIDLRHKDLPQAIQERHAYPIPPTQEKEAVVEAAGRIISHITRPILKQFPPPVERRWQLSRGPISWCHLPSGGSPSPGEGCFLWVVYTAVSVGLLVF